jgi:hypothetical protein
MSGIGQNFGREAAALDRALARGAITLEEYRAGLKQAGLEIEASRKWRDLHPIELDPTPGPLVDMDPWPDDTYLEEDDVERPDDA